MAIDRNLVSMSVSIVGLVAALVTTVFAKSDRVAQLEVRVESVERRQEDMKQDILREFALMRNDMKELKGDIKKILNKQ
jgi:hypothetical protein